MPIRFAQIEPTTRCNYVCGFCAGRAMVQRDLAWEDFVAFLSASPDLEHVELQGEGEPLLHPRFFDMAAALRARGATVSLITNGSLLTPETVERLIAADLATIHVSLETVDPARFRAIRGGRFEKVVAGIRALVAERRRRDRILPAVGLAVTLLRDDLAGVPAIADFYAALGLDGGILVQPLQTMPAYLRNYTPKMAAQRLSRKMADELPAIHRALAAAAPARAGIPSFYAALFGGFDPAARACPWLVQGAYLSAGGAVMACCFTKEDDAALGAAVDTPAVVAGRAEMSDRLARGDLPAACVGCGTAAAIATYAPSPPGGRGISTSL